ncbi:MAG TPA: HAD-IA family hydrolase [Draconibacterium sp.]|jgi:HAD superfamily hydrolase (TIGR01509 family)|nr:HAD-IA family hydrolase [Draconibacterium sp.]
MQKIKAIFFDMDGTIIDTEKDGHRVAFNEAFARLGIKAEWDVAKYHQLLQIAGGKERMKFFFQKEGKKFLPAGIPIDDFVQQLHLLKTEIFVSLIETGKLPLRPGIKRLMQEANEMGILIGICTTSNEKAVKAIVNSLLADIKIDLILAGDVVTKKKPDPEIYLLALQKTGLTGNDALVVEDSENGLIAGKAAGIKVLVTVNEYTKNENMTEADAVLTSLGNENEKAKVLAGNFKLSDGQMVHIQDLLEL